jgi:dihydroxy-acid dehydratase
MCTAAWQAGVPLVMKELLEGGLLHGDCMTVTGRTVRDNLKVTVECDCSSSVSG